MAIFDWGPGRTYEDLPEALAAGASFGLTMAEDYEFPGYGDVFYESSTILIPAFDTTSGAYTVDVYGTVGNIYDNTQIELAFDAGVAIGIDGISAGFFQGFKFRNLKLTGGTDTVTMTRFWTIFVPLYEQIYMPNTYIGTSSRNSGIVSACIINARYTAYSANSGIGSYVRNSVLISSGISAFDDSRAYPDIYKSTIICTGGTGITTLNGGKVFQSVIYGSTYAIGSLLTTSYCDTEDSIFYSASSPELVSTGLTIDQAFNLNKNCLVEDPLLSMAGTPFVYVVPTSGSSCDPANRTQQNSELFTGKINLLPWIGSYQDYTAISPDDIIDEAGGNFVVSTLTNAKILLNTVWGLTGLGSRVDAPEASVEDGTLYGPDGTGLEGSLVIDYASGDDLRLGVSQNSGAIEGNLVLPTAGQIQEGVASDSNGSVIGTYDNATNPDYVISSRGGNWLDTNLVAQTVKKGIAYAIGLLGDYDPTVTPGTPVLDTLTAGNGQFTANFTTDATTDVISVLYKLSSSTAWTADTQTHTGSGSITVVVGEGYNGSQFDVVAYANVGGCPSLPSNMLSVTPIDPAALTSDIVRYRIMKISDGEGGSIDVPANPLVIYPTLKYDDNQTVMTTRIEDEIQNEDIISLYDEDYYRVISGRRNTDGLYKNWTLEKIERPTGAGPNN